MQEVSVLQEELGELRSSQQQLVEVLEVKERRLAELEILLRESGGGQGGQEGHTVRQMEVGVVMMVDVLDSPGQVDLARKSDLLSEVKVLLKQAADRERGMEREKVGEGRVGNHGLKHLDP